MAVSTVVSRTIAQRRAAHADSSKADQISRIDRASWPYADCRAQICGLAGKFTVALRA